MYVLTQISFVAPRSVRVSFLVKKLQVLLSVYVCMCVYMYVTRGSLSL